MLPLSRAQAVAFLIGQGLSPAESETVLSGFDFAQPIYEHHFFDGDSLYQLVRHASMSNPAPARGSWYGLAGITTANVAVIGGLAGRSTYKFEVVVPFVALEGTAAALPINWEHEIGGAGGGTQIYVPRVHAGKIQPRGPVAPW